MPTWPALLVTVSFQAGIVWGCLFKAVCQDEGRKGLDLGVSMPRGHSFSRAFFFAVPVRDGEVR